MTTLYLNSKTGRLSYEINLISAEIRRSDIPSDVMKQLADLDERSQLELQEALGEKQTASVSDPQNPSGEMAEPIKPKLPKLVHEHFHFREIVVEEKRFPFIVTARRNRDESGQIMLEVDLHRVRGTELPKLSKRVEALLKGIWVSFPSKDSNLFFWISNKGRFPELLLSTMQTARPNLLDPFQQAFQFYASLEPLTPLRLDIEYYSKLRNGTAVPETMKDILKNTDGGIRSYNKICTAGLRRLRSGKR